MRKLKLQVEDLEVVSFETNRTLDERGTVAGYKTLPPTEMTCEGQASCDVNYPTCNNGDTCYNSCDGCGSYRTDCALCISAAGNCIPA